MTEQVDFDENEKGAIEGSSLTNSQASQASARGLNPGNLVHFRYDKEADREALEALARANAETGSVESTTISDPGLASILGLAAAHGPGESLPNVDQSASLASSACPLPSPPQPVKPSLSSPPPLAGLTKEKAKEPTKESTKESTPTKDAKEGSKESKEFKDPKGPFELERMWRQCGSASAQKRKLAARLLRRDGKVAKMLFGPKATGTLDAQVLFDLLLHRLATEESVAEALLALLEAPRFRSSAIFLTAQQQAGLLAEVSTKPALRGVEEALQAAFA